MRRNNVFLDSSFFSQVYLRWEAREGLLMLGRGLQALQSFGRVLLRRSTVSSPKYLVNCGNHLLRSLAAEPWCVRRLAASGLKRRVGSWDRTRWRRGGTTPALSRSKESSWSGEWTLRPALNWFLWTEGRVEPALHFRRDEGSTARFRPVPTHLSSLGVILIMRAPPIWSQSSHFSGSIKLKQKIFPCCCKAGKPCLWL